MFINKIKARNLPIFQYIFEAKYNFLIYISKIGGLIRLWFGLAVIDTHIFITYIAKHIKDYLINYLITDYLINELKRVKQIKNLCIYFVKIKLFLKHFI